MADNRKGPSTPAPESEAHKRIGAALGAIPSGLFVLTASYEERRTGMLAAWVQQVCFEPPMVSVAISKGRSILPLISESRAFGLCQLPEGERVIHRKFTTSITPGDDPFLGFELVDDTVTEAPIFKNALAWMECEVSCHMDVEGDHDLFVGLILNAGRQPGAPAVRIRDDGFTY